MKTIDIQLNQAKIQSYSVELTEGKMPEVSANIGLFSGSKKIASFGLRTQTYYSEGMSFELPASMIEPIVEISRQLEVILVRECNKQLKRLPDIVEAENEE
jgi:hypothetical protein